MARPMQTGDIFGFALDMVKKHNADRQTVKAAEELGELQQECFKAVTGRFDADRMAEEIADVLIVLEELKLIYDIQDSSIEDWIRYKIERERNRGH